MLKNIYGFDRLGHKVKIGSYDDGYYPVGGRIFYIDSNSDETVKFYDSNFQEITNVAVGDSPAYYKVTSAGVSGIDKFYVYNDLIGTDKYWSYVGTRFSNSDSIGYGKINTSAVLNVTDSSQYANDSIWTWLNTQNTNKLGNCDDWYIASYNELKKLKDYVDANSDGSVVIDFFTGSWVSSSSSRGGLNDYCGWGSDMWLTNLLRYVKSKCCAIRSF